LINLSIIIPCSDSLETVKFYLPHIVKNISHKDSVELLFVDAWERIELKNYVESQGFKYLFASKARRSGQCNLGAKAAAGSTYFFLHVDSEPPKRYDEIICDAVKDGFEAGSFKLKFDSSSKFLSAFAWFTQFKWSIARGGDQGLFVKKDVFEAIGGYKNAWQIMEDVDIARRLLLRRKFAILKPALITSSRKYERVGIVKLQFLFSVIMLLYWMGISNKTIYRFYLNNIAPDEIKNKR